MRIQEEIQTARLYSSWWSQIPEGGEKPFEQFTALKKESCLLTLHKASPFEEKDPLFLLKHVQWYTQYYSDITFNFMLDGV